MQDHGREQVSTTGLNPSLSRLTNGASPCQSYPIGRGLTPLPNTNKREVIKETAMRDVIVEPANKREVKG